MKHLFAILVLGFLAFGSAGFSAGTAAAGPANCAPSAASILDGIEDMADPAAYAESPSVHPRSALADGPQLAACNTACARACAQRFGRCPTRQCRQQFNACVRGCGC